MSSIPYMKYIEKLSVLISSFVIFSAESINTEKHFVQTDKILCSDQHIVIWYIT